MFVGVILGAALTVAAAYLHDLRASGIANGPRVAQRTAVNWDVVETSWCAIVLRARQLARLAAG